MRHLCHAEAQQKHFKEINHNLSRKPFELIHADLVIQIYHKSIGGSKYFLTTGDDYSRKIFTYFKKNKSDTFKPVKIFILRLNNNNYNNKMLKIRTDNG